MLRSYCAGKSVFELISFPCVHDLITEEPVSLRLTGPQLFCMAKTKFSLQTSLRNPPCQKQLWQHWEYFFNGGEIDVYL